MARFFSIPRRTLLRFCLATSVAAMTICVMMPQIRNASTVFRAQKSNGALVTTLRQEPVTTCNSTGNCGTKPSPVPVERKSTPNGALVTTLRQEPVTTCNSTGNCGTKPSPVPVERKSTPLYKFYETEKVISPPEYLLPRNRSITPLNFPFFITGRTICPKGSNPLLLLAVLSQHENEARRNTIRKTWGRVARGKPWPDRFLCGEVSLVFLLGRHQNEALNQKVRKEAEVEQDIMMADFIDSYRNLTYKSLMALKWMKTFCHGAKFIMKVDDDSFPDIPRIMNVITSKDMNNTIFGPYSPGGDVERVPHSKHKVAKSAYFPDSYPPHVKGVMYVIPNELVFKIVNVSEYFPYVNIEDATVTGILANSFHVRYLNIPDELYDRYPKGFPDDCTFALEKKLVAQSITPSVAVRLWTGIERRKQCENRAIHTLPSDDKQVTSFLKSKSI